MLSAFSSFPRKREPSDFSLLPWVPAFAGTTNLWSPNSEPRSASEVKIASWNVNSVKARLPHLLAFLGEAQPDVLALQETKCLAAEFPMLEVKALGYHVETIGQRA